MKKTFESFINERSLNLEEVNKLLKDRRLISIIENTLSRLPESWKTKIKNYLIGHTIDIDKMINISRKLNLSERITKLYKSGIRDIKDIYDKIFPKNEDLLLAGILIIVAIAAFVFAIYGIVCEIEEGGTSTGIFIIVCVIALGTLSSYFAYSEITKDKKEENREIRVSVKKDNREHIIILKVDSTGNYTTEEVEGDW